MRFLLLFSLFCFSLFSCSSFTSPRMVRAGGYEINVGGKLPGSLVLNVNDGKYYIVPAVDKTYARKATKSELDRDRAEKNRKIQQAKAEQDRLKKTPFYYTGRGGAIEEVSKGAAMQQGRPIIYTGASQPDYTDARRYFPNGVSSDKQYLYDKWGNRVGTIKGY